MLFCAHGRRAQEQTAVPIIVCHAPKNKVPYKVLDTCHTPPLLAKRERICFSIFYPRDN